MKEKGFTLIELLAVIVILAIIALIATPIILGIINDAKENANKRSAELYIDAVEQAIVRKNLTEQFKPNLCDIDTNGNLDCDGIPLDVEVDGKVPSGGWIYVTDGVIKQYSLKLEVNIVINKDAEGNITIGTEVAKNPTWKPICKRADVKTLHTETCTQTSDYCYAAGYKEGNKGTTIKYGNETTTAKKLNSGDAFDCDVNGDGKYDSQTERFYYVSKLNGDETSNIAVLIYYNNTTNVIPDNTSSSLIAYHSSNINNLGPVTGVVNLPTVKQWSNVKLSNITRQITNQKGGTTTTTGNITSFTYKNTNGVAYAGRLLTVQEVNSACKITVGSYKPGELDSCNYLMENTKFSSSAMGTSDYWLESPHASYSDHVWLVNGHSRFVGSNFATISGRFGVRPAIEILESDISY